MIFLLIITSRFERYQNYFEVLNFFVLRSHKNHSNEWLMNINSTVLYAVFIGNDVIKWFVMFCFPSIFIIQSSLICKNNVVISIRVWTIITIYIYIVLWTNGIQLWKAAKPFYTRKLLIFRSICLHLLSFASYYTKNSNLHKDFNVTMS